MKNFQNADQLVQIPSAMQMYNNRVVIAILLIFGGKWFQGKITDSIV